MTPATAEEHRERVGHTLGQPGNAELQRRVIADMIPALASIVEPGTLIELPYRWPEGEKG